MIIASASSHELKPLLPIATCIWSGRSGVVSRQRPVVDLSRKALGTAGLGAHPPKPVKPDLHRHNFQKPVGASTSHPKGSSSRGVQTLVSTWQDGAPTGRHRDSVAGNERVVAAVHGEKSKRRPPRALFRCGP